MLMEYTSKDWINKYLSFIGIPSGEVLDVYIGKAVCNEKCKHGLGRVLKLFFNKEILYSIRLVPGSSPGQPTITILTNILKSYEILYSISMYRNLNSSF
jgi:hypothetical protein